VGLDEFIKSDVDPIWYFEIEKFCSSKNKTISLHLHPIENLQYLIIASSLLSIQSKVHIIGKYIRR
jgi:hypothetical protein